MVSSTASFPPLEGIASRQAHCDLPEGTFERELAREGFFGPAAQIEWTGYSESWNAAGPVVAPKIASSKAAE